MRTTLELEIGAGVGWHAIQRARAHPMHTYIAIEHGEERFSKFVSRLRHHPPIPNLFAIQADAVRWSRQNIGPASLDRVFILYPNPCDKKKLANRRWFRHSFMRNLVRMLKPEGEIILASNMGHYLVEAKEWAQHYWGLDVLRDVQVTVPRTHFEKKYLARGEICREITFKRVTR